MTKLLTILNQVNTMLSSEMSISIDTLLRAVDKLSLKIVRFKISSVYCRINTYLEFWWKTSSLETLETLETTSVSYSLVNSSPKSYLPFVMYLTNSKPSTAFYLNFELVHRASKQSHNSHNSSPRARRSSATASLLAGTGTT